MDHLQAKTRGKIAYLTAALLGSNQTESVSHAILQSKFCLYLYSFFSIAALLKLHIVPRARYGFHLQISFCGWWYDRDTMTTIEWKIFSFVVPSAKVYSKASQAATSEVITLSWKARETFLNRCTENVCNWVNQFSIIYLSWCTLKLFKIEKSQFLSVQPTLTLEPQDILIAKRSILLLW